MQSFNVIYVSIILGQINIDVDEIALAKQRQHPKIGKLSSPMADSSAHNPKKLFYKKNPIFYA